MTDQTRKLPDCPPRPALTLPDPTGIPPDLAARDQWLCWDFKWAAEKNGKPGKWTKVPINPRTGRPADATDQRAMASLPQALAARVRFDLAGVGYAFRAEDPYAGIDLDRVREPDTGELDPAALALVEQIDSYTEPSVSGRGLHLIVKLTSFPSGGNRAGNIETYWRDRFFTFTGRPLPDYETIQDRTTAYTAWHRETFPPRHPPAPPVWPTSPVSLDTRDLLERCRGSEKFRRLETGDLSDYAGDASSADLAFIDVIVRNGGTPQQADELYRASGICRPKWDERRGNQTYGERTIARAFDGTVIPFAPAPGRSRPNQQVARLVQTPSDTNDPLPDDIAELKALVVDLRTRVEAAERRAEQAEARATAAEEQARRLSLLQSKTMTAFRSKNLGNEKFTGIALAFELASQQSVHPGQEEFAIPYARIADQAGLHESTVATHIKDRLEPLNLFDRRVEFTPERVDHETGEIIPAKNQTIFRPKIDPLAMLDTLASATHVSGKAKNGHGGARITCPEHPDAGTIRRVTIHCAECDRELDRQPDEYHPPAATPNEQVAGLVDPPLTTNRPKPRATPPRARPSPSVVNVLRTSPGRTCHNDEAATSVAGAWQRGQPLPAFDRPPPERSADGGRQGRV